MSDAKHSESSIEVTTVETVGIIDDIMLADRKLKVRESLEPIRIFYGSVVSNLNQ